MKGSAVKHSIQDNIDGGFQPQKNNGDCGAIIQDQIGEVKASAAGKLENIANPLHAEVLDLANTYGAQVEAARVIRSICFETDSVVLKQGVQKKDID